MIEATVAFTLFDKVLAGLGQLQMQSYLENQFLFLN
jgi:hypothetical protein